MGFDKRATQSCIQNYLVGLSVVCLSQGLFFLMSSPLSASNSHFVTIAASLKAVSTNLLYGRAILDEKRPLSSDMRVIRIGYS